ncbi:MAG: D-aminoacyl-tRNA deacylase [Polyangiaceae bacterium]|nr:D-aminoacyl-tRNA deacylase [Polyangiaceae bacterium]
MRAVVQRVAWAKVEIDGKIHGSIARGLLVYLGAGKGDGAAERAYVLSKILGLRIFENDAGKPEVPPSGGPTAPKARKMDKSVIDVGGALLVVSQFTLYGDVRRGRRPSFDAAMPPEDAERAYDAFVAEARAQGIHVETGKFRADMAVSSLNEGPVTIWIDKPPSI